MTIETAVALAVGMASLAMLLAAVALFRAYVPPQQRLALETAARVGDLEVAVEDVCRRLGKRASRENMEQARTAAEENKQRRQRIETEALALIEAHKGTGAPGTQAALPMPPSKAELRRAVGLVR